MTQPNVTVQDKTEQMQLADDALVMIQENKLIMDRILLGGYELVCNFKSLSQNELNRDIQININRINTEWDQAELIQENAAGKLNDLTNLYKKFDSYSDMDDIS